jgi:ABC-type transport system involved in cytochrome bd biosynthesis fused ATPase/permease subunit
MEFSLGRTVGVFVALFAIIAIGTFMSPMAMSTVMMVLGGLLVFGVLTLFVGVQHGKYRATNR